MTFENDFVHVEMFCIKKDTKIEPAWRFVFHLIPFREKQARWRTYCKIGTPTKSTEEGKEASDQLASPREWLQERYIETGFPLPAFSPR